MSQPEPIPLSHRASTRRQCREMDRRTIEEFGIDGFTLMEIAGWQAAEQIARHYSADAHGSFYCGKGNNAGDALVAARYLADRYGHSVDIIWTAGSDSLTADTEHNNRLLQTIAEQTGRIRFYDETCSPATSCNYIVDGLLGTGFEGELREPYRSAAQQINDANLPVIALDIPTGLDCDTGIADPHAVCAAHTITFGALKTGFYFNDGPACSGTIHLAELPFPSHLNRPTIHLLDADSSAFLPVVQRTARHKYEQGTVHIVAGSEGLTGAAILAARSAWNAGAGAVFLYAPKALLSIYEINLPEILTVGVGEPDDTYFHEGQIKSILERIEAKPGALVIGPGLGRRDETTRFVTTLLSRHTGHAVIDADALATWPQLQKIDAERRSKWLLTPHPGELANDFSRTPAHGFDRMNAVQQLSDQVGVSILSKGQPSVLCTPEEPAWVTRYDTTVFARAGSGDHLAGTIGTFLTVTGSIQLAVLRAMLHGLNTPQSSL
ncbi:MAG: NAD(P)H-hydrate dehydratase [Balneolaceae bacterium]